MRLRRLDLIRYGRFTDRVLDFGDAGEGPDVTIVYGPNEAGKSTAFAAWLDLLFGFAPRNHPYEFLHARRDLMVGAVLEGPGAPLALRRTAQQTGSLTDEAGRAVDERRLQILLHGLDRTGYRTRFSLDEAVLREGGEEIARAKGDLGQLLHAGSSGLSGFAEVLARVEAEADAFHKPRGRSTVLAAERNRLREIDAALAAARLDPRRFDALRRDVELAEEAVRATGLARDAAQRRLMARLAADRRRALAAEIAGMEAKLAGMPDGPSLPADAVTRVSFAAAERATAADAMAGAEAARADAEARLGALARDAEGERIGILLDELEAAVFDDGQPLVHRAATAEADIARREEELATMREEARGRAVALAGAGADPAALVLPRDVLAAIREAALRVRSGAEALETARQGLGRAEAELGEAEEMPEGAAALAEALDAHAGLPADCEALAIRMHESEAAARRAAAGLPGGWRGLAEAGLPAVAELRAAERALGLAEDRVAEATARQREAEEELAEGRSQVAAEAAGSGVVSDDDLASARELRDGLWQAHRGRLDAASADAFERAMHADDAAQARHGRTVDARARLRQLGVELARRADRAGRRRRELDAALADREAPAEAVDALALRLGLARGTPAAAHAERRDLLAAAFEAALAADEVARDLRRAEGAEAAARARVATGLAVVAPGHGTGDPVLAARALRAELEERGRRIASRGQAARLVARMAEECRLREAAQAASEAALAASLAGLWCEGRGADEMLRLIEGLGELGDAQRQAEERAHRVAQLRAALAAFDSRAAELRRVLDTGPGEGAAATLRQARARKDAAGEIARAIGSAVEARDRAAATLRDQAQIVRLREGAIADLLRGQAVEAGDPVEAIYLLADRDALRARRAEKGGEREAAGQGIDREALTEEEAETDPVRTAALEEAVRLAGEDRDAAFHRRGEAQSALDAAQRAAGGAELAQERAALLEGVREEARRAAVARIGLMAASGALRRLREDRRGPMLTATERAFSRMTGGEWQRLETQPTGTGERLVGIRSGVAVGAEAMSTGTRGQLYLALRVAGHADFAQRFGPLPFVTDDILETFDDARAAAALTLTAEMGRLGQAIMFTHHRHLVALGREVVPGVNVIDMAKDAPA